jgi:DNA-binding beta-propeller fold protein YncE
MDQLFLRSARKVRWILLAVCVASMLLVMPASAKKETKKDAKGPTIPDLLLDGGRKLSYERSFSSEQEVKPKKGFWTKVVDVVVGAPTYHSMIRPYSITTDSRGRIIVTDPGAHGVHIFDFTKEKYKFISRLENGKDPLKSPQCVAVDVQDNIYVTDSEAGKIFVFDANGKFQRTIGSLKYGEGFFKRPTGIAVDSAAQRIYISDTLLKKIGQNGTGNGEFNFPTELHLDGPNLLVVDAMNFRVQVLDRAGEFQYAIGKIGDEVGGMFRPKGIAMDSEGHLYIVDGMWSVVQVFNREGQLLYYFGQLGTGPGAFQLPAGLRIDGNDRIYVVDSLNKRVQVYHYLGLAGHLGGRAQ